MKRLGIVLFATIMASVFAFTSCGKDDNNEEGGTPVATTYKGSYKMILDGVTSTKMYNHVTLHFDDEDTTYELGAYGINPANHKFVFVINNLPDVGVQSDIDILNDKAPSVAVMYPDGEETTFVSYSGHVKRDTEDKATVEVSGRIGQSTDDVILTGTLNVGIRN